MTSSHVCLLAGDKGELLKDLHQGQLHHQLSKSHADAVPGPCSEGQVGVWINVVFVLFAEPERKRSEKNELRNKCRSTLPSNVLIK